MSGEEVEAEEQEEVVEQRKEGVTPFDICLKWVHKCHNLTTDSDRTMASQVELCPGIRHRILVT